MKATRLLLIAILLLSISTIANAQATRTWVSGVGDDVNPCSRTAPCKTFAGCISKTAPGGEINALDPGGFGAVTVTKAMTFDGDGTLASCLNAGSPGFFVNAGTADKVTIRHVKINGGNSGTNGVRVFQAKSVHIEYCEIFDQGGS